MTTYYDKENNLRTSGDTLYYGGKSNANMSLAELKGAYSAMQNFFEQSAERYRTKYANSLGGGQPLSIEEGRRIASSKQAGAVAWMDKLQGQIQTKQAELDMENYRRQMAEYMSMMAEAMNREEPAAEPLKAAAEVQSAARADTNRKQLLRRGLMSTLTRYGQGGQAQKLGA